MPLTELDFVWRLLAAAVFGFLLGLERSLVGKHAGMRTYALVALGSALFTVVGIMASQQLGGFGSLDPLRIASSIVIGIGFIGAGLAALHGNHPVELTTAAGIWVAAGIGMASGFGLYVLAGAGAIIAAIILALLQRVESYMRQRFGTDAD